MARKFGYLCVLLVLSLNAVASDPPDLERPRGAGKKVAAEGSRITRRPLDAKPLIALDGAATKVNTDAANDQEPVIATNTIGTTHYSVAAFMKFPDRAAQPYNVRINVRATTPNHFGWNTADLEHPVGVYSGDPAIAVNPYTNGFHPERFYLVGSTFQAAQNGVQPNWLRLWFSDQGGFIWSSPITLDSDPNGVYFFDKAAVTVAWKTTYRGHVFVAAMKYHLSGGDTPRIRIYRSNSDLNGTMKFDLMHEEVAPGAFSPQIVVDYWTNDVYVLWLERVTNKIQIMRSWDQGDTFTRLTPFDTLPMQYPPNKETRAICGKNGSTATCVDAVSSIAARYNWAHRSIGVVWNERESSTNASSVDTDVYFNAFVPGLDTWQGKKRVSSVSTNDQWAPALDFDEAGNYVVTYYDRRDDANDVQFRAYATKLTGAGDRITGQPDISLGGPYDPTVYYNNSGSGNYSLHSVGEYQDVWYANAKWHNAHICIPVGSTGDPCVAKINP